MLGDDTTKNVTGTDAFPADVATSTLVWKNPFPSVPGFAVIVTCAADPPATGAGRALAEHHEA